MEAPMTTAMSVYHYYAFFPDDPTLATAADDVWHFCHAAVGGTSVRSP